MYEPDSGRASKTAIDLAKTNIQSTTEWVQPEEVTRFIKEVYEFLIADAEE